MNKPLFYRQVVPVDKNRHRDVSMAPVTDMTFAAGTNSVIVLAAEFSKACREYPLVFVADQGNYFPAAVLGLQDGQNLFIKKDGAWQATYIPAYVRRYPFIPALQEGKTDYLVCIDEGFAGFNREGRGERLFLEDGAQSKTLERSLSFLQEFQVQHQRTMDFCAVMRQHDLMEPMQADVAMASGKKLQLNGFFVVSRKKMAALPDETIASLYRQGYLELAIAHLLSLGNFERLVALEGGKAV
jgi:hypothetical protein